MKFIEYIEKRFSNKIEEEMKSYLAGLAPIYAILDGGCDLISFEISEIRYKRCFSFQKGWDTQKIEADIKVGADITCTTNRWGKEVKEKIRDMDFILFCEGDFGLDLDDFAVQDISPYTRDVENYERKRKGRLDDYLVPVIKAADYENCARAILLDFMPESVKSPKAVDGEVLVRRMGLNVLERSISRDGSVFGRLYLCDAEDDLYDASTNKTKRERIPANTVVLDRKLADCFSSFSYNGIFAHEAVHAKLHKIAHSFRQLSEGSSAPFQKTILPVNEKEADFIEIQANALVPYILIPQRWAEKKYRRFWSESFAYINDEITRTEKTVQKFARFYKVPLSLAKKRLKAYGYPVDGIEAVADGHHIRAYIYAQNALKTDETFLLDTKNFRDVFFTQSIEGMISRGEFVFLENHLCLNDLKFICKNERGGLALTDYALTHMDECCVRFKREYIGKKDVRIFAIWDGG